MTNNPAATLAAIVFHSGGATYIAADGVALPAPDQAAAVAVAALWDRPSPN